MTLREMHIVDSIGLPKFEEKRAQAIINKIRKEKLLSAPPPTFEQPNTAGIVIVGGGKYLSWSHVLCRRLRELGSRLPIQVWHMGSKELPNWARSHFQALDAQPVDIYEVMRAHPVRQMSGWIAKTFAVRHCPWEQAIFIDADCFPELAPEALLDNAQIRAQGSLLFKDVGRHHQGPWGYLAFGLQPLPYEYETGQFIWHKTKAWDALQWALWCHEHTNVFYKMFHGDKGVIEACFRSTGAPFVTGEHSEWMGWGIAHYLDGQHVFSHCMGIKRGEFKMPRWMENYFSEWRALEMNQTARVA